jgi:major type 1 subunit fimbrin (pilin)
VLLAGVSCPAFAGPNNIGGTITFTGNVTDTTCDVVGGYGTGGETSNITVVLDSVPTSALTAAGNTAGGKAFQLILGGQSGCTIATPGTAQLSYDPSSVNIDGTNSGTLKNTAVGGATNTNIQLVHGTDSGGQVLDLGNALLNQPIAPDDATAPNQASWNFFAQYFSTVGGSTPGAVKSNVQYKVSYN